MVRPERMPLERLEELPVAELKQEWARCHGTPAPNLSADLLRLGIAYRLQEKRHGGISRESRRILRHSARAMKEGNTVPAPPPQRKLTPGTRLVRDWRGTGHTVTVLDDGFEYDGRPWRSLTAIAKAITGTHRNGPRFFGLT
jgi:hypothetical protein